MKVFINCNERESRQGTRFIEVVSFVHETVEDEPMTTSGGEKAAGAHVELFVLNGLFVVPGEYETLEIKEDDEIRWVHPYSGG